MRKIVEVERTFCDECGAKAGFSTCISCGKEFCYICEETKAVKYRHAVYFSGSGDGLYCNKCDVKLLEDPLHEAYVAIDELKEEAKEWGEDFNSRSKNAEETLKRLQGKKTT